jgi:hypothetical protein
MAAGTRIIFIYRGSCGHAGFDELRATLDARVKLLEHQEHAKHAVDSALSALPQLLGGPSAEPLSNDQEQALLSLANELVRPGASPSWTRFPRAFRRA